MSLIFLYAEIELLDELDAVEMGEKLLSGTYFVVCAWGFSSPVGLFRRSNKFAWFDPDSGGSSTSQVNWRIRSSSDVSGFVIRFLYLKKKKKIQN